MFSGIINGTEIPETCNQGNKYMEMCSTILFINICNLFHGGIKRIRSHLELTNNSHDYSSFFTAFNVASYIRTCMHTKQCLSLQFGSYAFK